MNDTYTEGQWPWRWFCRLFGHAGRFETPTHNRHCQRCGACRCLALVLLLLAVLVPPASASRHEHPGGLYPDRWPSGGMAVIYPDRVETSIGRLPLPNGERLLFADVAPRQCGFKLAAKSQDTNTLWIYDGAWRPDGRISHGTQGHIWTPSCDLFVITPAPDQESQGVRYWDGGPVFGSPTYDYGTPLARSLGVTRLFEWTKCGRAFVGQGEIGGTVAQFEGHHYLIEPGDSRFVQCHAEGDTLAIAITRFAAPSVTWVVREGELPMFPIYPLTVPTPPAPDPEPDPEPEPEPQYQRRSPDYQDKVVEIARRFPVEWEAAREDESTGKKRTDAFIRRLAWELHTKVDANIGLNGKRGGNTISLDALAYKNPTAPGGAEVIDVIGGSRHTPEWQDVTLPNVLGRFIQPTDPGGSAEPDPEPDASVVEALRAEIEALNQRIVELEFDLNNVLTREHENVQRLLADIRALTAERDALLARPEPRCEAKLFGVIKIPCKVIR